MLVFGLSVKKYYYASMIVLECDYTYLYQETFWYSIFFKCSIYYTINNDCIKWVWISKTSSKQNIHVCSFRFELSSGCTYQGERSKCVQNLMRLPLMEIVLLPITSLIEFIVCPLAAFFAQVFLSGPPSVCMRAN